jgi:ABC-2 type transport system permease protein
VLEVLVVTTEYSTGSVRSTFVAVPQRREVLAAKAAVFAGATFCSASALGR